MPPQVRGVCSWVQGRRLKDTHYVADDQTIREAVRLGTNWVVATIGGVADSSGGYADGAGSSAEFGNPAGVTADRAGNLYVADTDNQAIRQGVAPPSVPQPPWQIAREADHVILSRPLSAAGFVLEAAGAAPTGVAWSPLTNGVFVVGDSSILINHLDARNAFYRLRRP